MTNTLLGFMILVSGGIGQPAPAATSQPAESLKTTPSGETTYRYANAGDLKAEVENLRAHLEKSPTDDNARMRLGFVEFFRGIEEMSQSLYQYGLRGPFGVVQMPFAPNPNPERISYEDTRRIVENWLASLERAEATLAMIRRDDVAFIIDVADIEIDLDSNGIAGNSERLGGLMRMNPSSAQAVIVIRFDRADVHWLRGYCHFLSGLCEFALAHDWKKLFEHAGQLLFKDIETPYVFLQKQTYQGMHGDWYPQIVDAIACIHLMRFPVSEPERLKRAHAHFKDMIRQSREMWAHAMKETDDQLEWLPNPKQHAVIELPITELMTSEWMRLLDESEAILDGRKLLPFWRDGESRGVNLKRVFMEPREFDVVLWAQGTAAVPYLEEGEITSPEFWSQIQRGFGGQLLWYSLWIN